MWKKYHLLTVTILLLATAAWAWQTEMPLAALRSTAIPAGTLLGQSRWYTIDQPTTLMELARERGLGFSNLKNANPEVDPWLLPQGETILLPYACILPVNAIAGLTINLAELRLYHLWKNEQGWQVRIYPVGIGSEGSETPLGDFSVLSKRENPIWTVPDSVRKTQPELPESVPPGPDNPLGQFWLGFASNGYGIHGTNKPFGIGRRVSHGCLRTYPEDIRELYAHIPLDTPVRIIRAPVKAGRDDTQLFIEVHRDFSEDSHLLKREFVRQARALNWSGTLDWEEIDRALEENRGIPCPVSHAGKSQPTQ